MAELQIIDDMVIEICKIRGVDLPPICIKMIVLTYLCYACNTYDIKYQNEDGFIKRINVGCIILCQKGTGKSRTLHVLKKIFSSIEKERQSRYEHAKFINIQNMENSEIPLTDAQKKSIENFYKTHGYEMISVFDDPITSKGLCAIYAQIKKSGVNNLLFTIDEAGDRIFKEALGRDPSISAKEFLQTLNQLFDGYCGMGQSRAAQTEALTSQKNIGANFIFVSTAEFLNDYHVQQKYESVFEGGLGRRCLYVNCPPIDKLRTDRKRYYPQFESFEKQAEAVFHKQLFSRNIKISEALWEKYLEHEGAASGVTIDEEYLLILFCVALAVWTGDEEIQPTHWEYMIRTYREMQNIAMPVIQKDTTNFDKICIFIREWLEKNSRKKIPISLVKDFCLRKRMCFDSQFKKWFTDLCNDFNSSNVSSELIQYNQKFIWLEKNYAFTEGGNDEQV